MKKRYFLVCPLYNFDTLWQAYSTTSRMSFLEAYQIDNCKEEKSFNNEKDAVRYVKSKGVRRVWKI